MNAATLQGGSRSAHHPPDQSQAVVSIIIVTRNAESYVDRCMQSIAMQPYKNLEVIVLDGASTDRTTDKLREWDSIISFWKSEPDNGIYDAMNNALAFATGNWFLFLGIDDELLPSFSAMCLHLKKSNVIYCGDCITDQGQVLNGNFSAYKLTKMNICHQGIFYPSAVFKKYRYNTRYKIWADYALNMQCWGDRHFKVQYYPTLVTRYHSGGFSSTQHDEAFEKDRASLVRQYLPWWVYLRFAWKQRKKRKHQHKQT